MNPPVIRRYRDKSGNMWEERVSRDHLSFSLGKNSNHGNNTLLKNVPTYFALRLGEPVYKSGQWYDRSQWNKMFQKQNDK